MCWGGLGGLGGSAPDGKPAPGGHSCEYSEVA